MRADWWFADISSRRLLPAASSIQSLAALMDHLCQRLALHKIAKVAFSG
jgi:hypothetical protein